MSFKDRNYQSPRSNPEHRTMTQAEALLSYFENMCECYERVLSDEEKHALHQWEHGADFTRTSDWPGWTQHIGFRPIADRRPILLRRQA